MALTRRNLKTNKLMSKRHIFPLLLLLCLAGPAGANDVDWYDGEHPVTYQVEGKVDPVVRIALRMFCSDIRLVTGKTPVEKGDATIRIVQGQGSDDGFRLSVSSQGKIKALKKGTATITVSCNNLKVKVKVTVK